MSLRKGSLSLNACQSASSTGRSSLNIPTIMCWNIRFREPAHHMSHASNFQVVEIPLGHEPLPSRLLAEPQAHTLDHCRYV